MGDTGMLLLFSFLSSLSLRAALVVLTKSVR